MSPVWNKHVYFFSTSQANQQFQNIFLSLFIVILKPELFMNIEDR